MKHLKTLSIFTILASGLIITGCDKQCKKDLAGLKHLYNELQIKNQDLQKRLEDCREKNSHLVTQLADKTTQLEEAQAELSALKASKVKKVTEAPLPKGWQRTSTGAKITLASDILFAPGRATLSRQGKARLRQIAATIKRTYPNSTVRVYGFTDSDPIKKSKKLWTDNLDLSANRAMAVVRLLRKLGIPAENLEAIGMGATHFVASNATPAGKARNRRVEIVVIK